MEGLEWVLSWSGKEEEVPCRFCSGRAGDGHLFWECTLLPILNFRELPEFVSHIP